MKYTTLAIVVLLIMGCGTAQENPQSVPPTHIVVGLDLSNRIEADGQIDRDLASLNAIISAFESNASFVDKISIQVIPQKGAPTYASNPDLYIDLENIPLSEIREELPRRTEAMRTAIETVYDRARKITDHTGADSWGWLRDLYLPVTTVSGDTIQHSIVMLTDGYPEADGLNFTLGKEATFIPQESLDLARTCADNSTPFQMLPARHDLENVSILTLEVRPRVEGLCEFRILEGVWSRWYDGMNAGYYEVHRSRSDTRATGDIIFQFLNRKEVHN